MSEAATASEAGAVDAAASLSRLNASQRDVLMALAAGPTHGLGAKHALDAGDHTSISRPSVYEALDKLVSENLATRREVDGRTNEYQLTDAGVEAVEVHLRWQLDKYVQHRADVDSVLEMLPAEGAER